MIVNKGEAFAWTFTWDGDTQMCQTIHQQQFDGNLSPEALIQTGRNLTVDATTLNNAYSSIEAGGDAKLTGSVLNNEGVALYQTITSTCEATGGCEAYDADGNHCWQQRRNQSSISKMRKSFPTEGLGIFATEHEIARRFALLHRRAHRAAVACPRRIADNCLA